MRATLITWDLDLYPQPPLNTRSPTLNSEEPENLPAGTRVETGIVYPWFDSPGGSRQVRLYTVHSVTKEHMYLSAQQLLEGPNPVLVRKTIK